MLGNAGITYYVLRGTLQINLRIKLNFKHSCEHHISTALPVRLFLLKSSPPRQVNSAQLEGRGPVLSEHDQTSESKMFDSQNHQPIPSQKAMTDTRIAAREPLWLTFKAVLGQDKAC